MGPLGNVLWRNLGPGIHVGHLGKSHMVGNLPSKVKLFVILVVIWLGMLLIVILSMLRLICLYIL